MNELKRTTWTIPQVREVETVVEFEKPITSEQAKNLFLNQKLIKKVISRKEGYLHYTTMPF